MLNNTERLKLIISKFENSINIQTKQKEDALLPANYEEKKSS